MLWGVVCVLVLVVLARQITPFFTADAEVKRYLVIFLWIMPFVFAFRGLGSNASAGMNAINKPLHAAMYQTVRLLGFQLAAAWAGKLAGGYAGMLAGMVIGDILAAGGAWVWIGRLYDVKPVPVGPVEA